MDKITEINVKSAKSHKKLYDVTVPETLNFVLANGLNIRDTSSSGYLQR
jgi:intein/homing endonuclease